MQLKQVSLQDHMPEALAAFQANNALLTAGDQTKCNTMTIGWCQLGRLWNQPVCTVYVRPERYTYQFMENQDTFSVAVLSKEQKDTMHLCGTKSGRELDKIRACGLTLQYGAENTPFFEEADWALVCRKLYQQDLDPAGVLSQSVIEPFYGKSGGWHRVYVGEVLEIWH